jgi:hypothetical protein
MAHYALLDENNTVVHVITGVDENIVQTDLDGTQVGGTSEAWEQFYASLPWFAGLTCKRTSYNSNIRGTYACIGHTYNPEEDIFVTPQPYPSWIRSGSFWNAPTPIPTDGKRYSWDEENLAWQEIVVE